MAVLPCLYLLSSNLTLHKNLKGEEVGESKKTGEGKDRVHLQR